MNTKNRTLRKAVKLLIKGQLTKCIQLLEPKITLFLENADYFYLLGRSYFTAGDIENAKLYLKRGLENDPEHEDILLVQACFAVKERNTYKAISIWLKLENSGYRKACLRYGLDQIRRINDSEELYNFTRSPRFARLFPPLPGLQRYRIMRRLRWILGFFLLLGVLRFTYSTAAPKLQQVYKDWRVQREQAEQISLSDLDGSEYLSFEKKTTPFTFSGKQLADLTKKIRRNYDLYNDNLVQRDINKIFLSNASDKVKAKFGIVESLLGTQQEIYNLKNNFRFQDVRENPQLYENSYILWEGKPTNIRIGKNGNLQFILLVGYIDGTVLEGQVLVLLEDLISVPTDQPLKVFGQVKIRDLAIPSQIASDAASVRAGTGGADFGISPISDIAAGKGQLDQSKEEAIFYIEAKTLARS